MLLQETEVDFWTGSRPFSSGSQLIFELEVGVILAKWGLAHSENGKMMLKSGFVWPDGTGSWSKPPKQEMKAFNAFVSDNISIFEAK